MTLDSGLADLVTDPPDDVADRSIPGSTDPGTDATCAVSSVEYLFWRGVI